MEEKNDSKKPLKSSSNKVKDLFNAYVKNEGGRAIPIIDGDAERHKYKHDEAQQIEEKHETEKIPDLTPMVEQLREQLEEGVAKVSELEQRVVVAEKERDEIKDQLLRNIAEIENIRRRAQREKMEMLDYANEKLLSKMLVLLDDLSNAIDAGRLSDDYEALLKGIEMIQGKAIKLFEDVGVKQMDNPIGKPLDVDFHEALMHIPADLPEGSVYQVVQPGYMFLEKVLRHAKVITSAGKPEAGVGI
ncbi:MAG: molecular chaperone GrpE [Bacteroidota bacterium]|nr:molecular chaperone GrpE [Bacteroidota bacterium]